MCIKFIMSQSTQSGWLKVDDPPCKKRKTREQQRQQNTEYDYDSGDRESFFCIGTKNLPGLSMYRRKTKCAAPVASSMIRQDLLYLALPVSSWILSGPKMGH